MSKVRFHAGDVDLELAGSEVFVVRQLKLLSSLLGAVDPAALEGAPTEPEPVYSLPESAPDAAAAAVAEPGEGNGGEERPPDDLMSFYRSVPPRGPDRQTDAALLFAYFLQHREGLAALQLSDFIRCCIRAGVDTRNFNRTLGLLTRRGLLETVRHGHAYRLSDQGVAAVESRI